MRIDQLHIDGYGRFVGKDVEIGPGLQVVFGPNERGKSTLRSFIGHMLYGQKRSIQQRRYDEDHELRRPWKPTPRYGGRLVYHLDNGTAIEVHREFDRKEEFIQIFDKTNATDITAEFEQFRNREIGFATAHLGIGKTVFENIANIGHWTLTDFDADALGDIRERIVALADSASEEGTAESALKLLDERALNIGRRAGQMKRPLPSAKARLEALDAEWTAAKDHLATLQGRESERQRLAEALANAIARRKLIATALGVAAKQSRAIKLREAERISDEIRVAEQTVFQFARAAKFPLEEVAEAQRAANAVASSRTHLTRATEELKSLHAQYNEASARAGGAIHDDEEAVSETLERDVSERQGKIDRLSEKLTQYEADFETARRELDDAAQAQEAAKDFDAIGPDPAERLTALASSFRVAEQSHAASIARASQLRETINDLRGETQQYDSRLKDLAIDTADDNTSAAINDTVARTAQALTARRRQMRSLILGAIAGCAFSAAFTALALTIQNPALILPAVLMGIGAVGAGLFWIYNLAWLARDRDAATSAVIAQEELEVIATKRDETIEAIRRANGIETDDQLEEYIRSLDRSKESIINHEQELDDCVRSEQRALAEIEALQAQHGDLFASLDESIGDEPASTVVHRLLAAYQAQHDHRIAHQRAQDQSQKLQGEIGKLRLELKALQGEQSAKLVDLREALRNAGFGDEARHFDALDALHAYRKTLSDARERKVRADTIGENRATKEQQHKEARSSLEQDEAELQARLERAGVDTLEEWEERAQEAKAHREARQTQQLLQDKLTDLLAGTALEKFRRQVADDGPITDEESSIIEEQIAAIGIEDETDIFAALRAEHDSAAAAADDIQSSHHTLQLELAAAEAATRPLNEIEEEREEARGQVANLTFELEAVSHAAAIIDEVARDRHARLAPRMTEIAGEYLGAITGGAYDEVMLNRELGVSVRVPETARFANEPRQMLSKGTVDQIYLALRLALVRVFSDSGESIPMLLDDPFSNYDDQRLGHALTLLQEVSKTNQIILFTCRDDVAKAASEIGVEPIAL